MQTHYYSWDVHGYDRTIAIVAREVVVGIIALCLVVVIWPAINQFLSRLGFGVNRVRAPRTAPRLHVYHRETIDADRLTSALQDVMVTQSMWLSRVDALFACECLHSNSLIHKVFLCIYMDWLII